MKKEKQAKRKPVEKQAKKLQNMKRGKRKGHRQEDEDFDELDSFSDIYDSDDDKESFSESFEPDARENVSEEEEDSLDEFEKEVKRECGDSKISENMKEEQSRALSENQSQILEEKNENAAVLEEKRKKLQELKRQRLEKYLGRSFKNSSEVKYQHEAGTKIKLESTETSSAVAPQLSQHSKWTEHSQVGSELSSAKEFKKEKSDVLSVKSKSSCNPDDPDADLTQYLYRIREGTVTHEEMEKRKKEEERRQKIQEKIKEFQKRKLQQKLKKEFDLRTESELKFQSTNMDSYNKQQQSFRMPPKSESGRLGQSWKIQSGENGDKQNGRKKRTRVTPDMLKQIIKEFEIMARQQNGVLPVSGKKITFRDIGRKFGLGRSSVMKMYSDYCKDPTMKSRFESRQSVSQNRTMMQLTKRRITFVQKLIRKDCTLSQREIAAVMNEHEDMKCKRKKRDDETEEEYLKDPYAPIAYKAVSRLMKLANFTRKKVTLIPKNRNSERTLEERYHFCRVLKELIADENNKLYFLDECRFNLFTSRDWGWAPKGELATKVRHNSKGKDIMLLAIIGKNGLVGYEVSDSYIRGSFTIAVQKMINSIIPEQLPKNERIYLILDNCPIHNKQILKEMQQTKPVTVLYLPPYSPMLNPIQSWFGELKRIIKSKIYKTRQAMKAELVRVLESYRTKSMANYYSGINKYIELGIRKELYRGNNKF